jgi:hypothetical protein
MGRTLQVVVDHAHRQFRQHLFLQLLDQLAVARLEIQPAAIQRDPLPLGRKLFQAVQRIVALAPHPLGQLAHTLVLVTFGQRFRRRLDRRGDIHDDARHARHRRGTVRRTHSDFRMHAQRTHDALELALQAHAGIEGGEALEIKGDFLLLPNGLHGFAARPIRRRRFGSGQTGRHADQQRQA